jgi:hypothetical protein
VKYANTSNEISGWPLERVLRSLAEIQTAFDEEKNKYQRANLEYLKPLIKEL